MIQIRPETPADPMMIHTILSAAFDTPAEANLVDALRQQARPFLSLVAEDQGAVVGHIVFSPVTLPGHPAMKILGLAPMAVTPDRQRQGIGSDLVRAGLKACRESGAEAVVVLGHPEYYPRFGFVPSSRFGIDSEYDVPEEVFLAQELVPGALAGMSGTVRYHAAFQGV